MKFVSTGEQKLKETVEELLVTGKAQTIWTDSYLKTAIFWKAPYVTRPAVMSLYSGKSLLCSLLATRTVQCLSERLSVV